MDKHVIRMLNQKGDAVLAEFDPAVKEEVEQAKSVFQQQLERGFQMFAVQAPLATPEGPVRVFDPQVKEHLVLRPIAGG